MVQNPQFHKQTKHIAIRWHWIHEQVQEKAVTIESIRDPEQTTDVLTKALPCAKHQQHVTEMRIAIV